MSQDLVNKPAPRHHYAGALATKFDPSIFGKMASNAASSKAASDMISSDHPDSSKVVSSKNISSSAEPSKATTSPNISNTTGPSKPASSETVSNGAESSRATSKQNKPPSTAPKTREQRIAEVLGYPPQPKGMIKDGKISWTQPSQTSSPKHIPSTASSHRAVSQEPSKLSAGAPPPPPAGSASQTSKFPCPYTDCTRGFLKEGDLRKHKMQDHDYCKICDEDFEDDEAFHKHKIMSERHITCTVCSLDFKSESGRDRHHKVVSTAVVETFTLDCH